MKNYWQNRKVLVTGAGGFVGSALCAKLKQNGARVTALVHKNLDLTNIAQVKLAINDESIIIHAAALDGGQAYKKRFAEKIFHDNILMTANLLEAIKNKQSFSANKQIEKFVYLSSAEVYNGLQKIVQIKEDDFQFFPTSKPEDLYAWSKIINEQLCQMINPQTEVLIVRPANIYGPGDQADKERLIPKILEAIRTKAGKIRLRGTGDQLRTFLFLDDYLENLLQLIQYSQGGLFNLAGQKIISIKSFTNLFAKLSGLRISFEKDQNFKPNIFVLSVKKSQKIIPKYYDSPYEEAIRKILCL